MDGISKEAFLKAKSDVRLELIFDAQEQTFKKIETLTTSFADRKIKDRSFATAAGFIGGFIASLTRGFFK